MIGAVVKELIGLFVDDELLAAAILCVVAPRQRIGSFRRGAGLARWSHAGAGFAGGARGERVAQRAAGER